ncbi:MAG: Flp family type IVb pilin [Parvibaculum sp.]|nr:Flp family type IVb pilin [Parvibaculum sp.]
MSQFLKSFVKNESGATAIEYGLIAAGISVVIITAVGTVGDNLIAKFEDIADKIAE